ncbi:hypothetical protein P5673_033338, partial [Acropora cervicornis]
MRMHHVLEVWLTLLKITEIMELVTFCMWLSLYQTLIHDVVILIFDHHSYLLVIAAMRLELNNICLTYSHLLPVQTLRNVVMFIFLVIKAFKAKLVFCYKTYWYRKASYIHAAAKNSLAIGQNETFWDKQLTQHYISKMRTDYTTACNIRVKFLRASLHDPGLDTDPVWQSDVQSSGDSIAKLTFFFPHALRSPAPFSLESAWARTLNRKKNGVQTIPGQMGHCLHEEIEEISTLLAGSTRVSRRVTRQGGLTRLDYRFYVNAYKHLTAKGLPAAVIQLGMSCAGFLGNGVKLGSSGLFSLLSATYKEIDISVT